MIIKTLWIKRKDQESPELLVSVDEWSNEENPDYFKEESKKQLDALNGDYEQERVIDIYVPYSALMQHFDVPKINGVVQEPV